MQDIASAGDAVYIATDGGLGIIRYEPYTLVKKAAYFERELDEWGFKRLGFIHKLYWAGDANGWLREISDNDGGNTAHYLAAMTFKYAATGDEAARQEAVDSFKAMIWLDDITGRPGFIARAIWSVKGDEGERAKRGSGGLPPSGIPPPTGSGSGRATRPATRSTPTSMPFPCSTTWPRKARRRSGRPSIWPISPRTSSTTAGCCGTWTANPPAGGGGTPTTCKRPTVLNRAGSTAWRP